MTPTNFQQELNEPEGKEVILACPWCHSQNVPAIDKDNDVLCYNCDTYSIAERAITEGSKYNDEATRRGI